jgi:Tol biopolymer transport system component/DNA-binding winged helix-turn-helix (wHTH) protein
MEASMGCYRFGPFELDIERRELRKYGTSIRIQRQPFLLLRTLVERGDRVVSREELRQIVWSDDTFVDFEHGLNAAMNKVRQALGDASDRAHYIETLPGQGYRFIAPVESRLDEKSAEPASAPPPDRASSDALPSQANAKSTGRFKRRYSWWIAAVGAVLISGGIWAVLHVQQTPADARVLSLQVNPPEGSEFTFGTAAAGISVSPDGRDLAYVATDHGKPAIWVRPLDGTGGRLLAGTEDGGLPFWSPDSKSLAFISHNKLQRVYLSGGTPQTICDVGQARGGSWGDDGRILYGGWNSGLFQVPASGGQASPLTMLDGSRGEVFHYWPQILPGGHFLYFVRSNKPENTGVYAASFAKPHEAVQLLSTEANAVYAPAWGGARNRAGYLLWLRSSTLVAQNFDAATLKLSGVPRPIADPVARVGVNGQMEVTVSDSGILVYGSANPLRQFKLVDRTGKPRASLGEPALNAFFHLSPDGKRVVVTRINSVGTDLWILEVDRGVPSRFAARLGLNLSPVWSPDSQTILYASDAPLNLFRKSANGTGAEQRLTKSPNAQFPMDWSRDGRFILYEEEAIPGSQRSLWTLPMRAGDAKPKPYQHTTFNESNGKLSPDTRWVAFQSDESGRFEIYVDQFPEPRGKVRISTGGGVLPRWSSDGRELFFVSEDSILMSVSLTPGGVSLEPSPPRALFPLLVLDTDVSPYDVTGDRESFLVLEAAEHAAQPLTVIANWPALLYGSTNSQ